VYGIGLRPAREGNLSVGLNFLHQRTEEEYLTRQ
jgi:hypothetical protein